MKNTYKKTTDQFTAKWLKANGINENQFDKAYTDTDLLLLKALKSANQILKSYGDLLTYHDEQVLNCFRLIMANAKDRKQLNHRQAFLVLNICAATFRKSFKQRKQLLKKHAQQTYKTK